MGTGVAPSARHAAPLIRRWSPGSGSLHTEMRDGPSSHAGPDGGTQHYANAAVRVSHRYADLAERLHSSSEFSSGEQLTSCHGGEERLRDLASPGTAAPSREPYQPFSRFAAALRQSVPGHATGVRSSCCTLISVAWTSVSVTTGIYMYVFWRHPRTHSFTHRHTGPWSMGRKRGPVKQRGG